ncbi:conserved hypothetical protein [uncultured Desulfatiglans sp.]|nr:conserved hypothetical protein [uncultured Desulfatiglans sp.]
MVNSRVFDEMVEKWPSAVVARQDVDKFSGGVLTSAYMANLDAKGEGPASFKIGRKRVYPARELVNWLRTRAV